MSLPTSKTLDEVLPYIGEYGRFQKLLDFIFCLMNIPTTTQVLIMTFWTVVPPWRCLGNNTECSSVNVYSGKDKTRCNLSRHTWEYVEHKQFSLVTQFDLHCDREWVLHFLQSVFFVGWAVGAIVLSWVSDKRGRKFLLFPSLAVTLALGFLISFLTNIYLILVFRFLIGFFHFGVIMQAYILISEIVGYKHRPFACTIILLLDPLSFSMLSLQAYLIRNWKILAIASTAPYFLLILTFRFVPESVKWLLSQGKVTEARRTLERIASWNNKQMPDNIIICTKDNQAALSQSTVASSSEVIKRGLILSFIWLVASIGYFGLYMAAGDLGGSLYRDFAIMSLPDLVLLFVSVYLCDRFGRKTCSVAPLIIAGSSCIAIGLMPLTKDFIGGRVTLGVIGKLCLGVSFNGLNAWSVESFPTRFRSEGMGLMNVAARIGGAASPWIAKGLGKFGHSYPFLAMGAPALVAFLGGLYLPETKPKVNPDTKMEPTVIIANKMEDSNDTNV